MNYRRVYVGIDEGCDLCVFIGMCAGDGDGTPIEGHECGTGYVWAKRRTRKSLDNGSMAARKKQQEL